MYIYYLYRCVPKMTFRALIPNIVDYLKLGSGQTNIVDYLKLGSGQPNIVDYLKLGSGR